MPRTYLGAVALLVACATTQPTAKPSTRVLASGGELTLSELPARTVQVNGQQIQTYVMTEVPADSRLQAAFAMADALARAELLKGIGVGVASVLTASTTLSADKKSESVSRIAAEVANGVVPGLPPPEHGWRKVERDGAVVLQVFARLTADRQRVAETMTHSMRSLPDGSNLAARAVELIGQQQVSP